MGSNVDENKMKDSASMAVDLQNGETLNQNDNAEHSKMLDVRLDHDGAKIFNLIKNKSGENDSLVRNVSVISRVNNVDAIIDRTPADKEAILSANNDVIKNSVEDQLNGKCANVPLPDANVSDIVTDSSQTAMDVALADTKTTPITMASMPVATDARLVATDTERIILTSAVPVVTDATPTASNNAAAVTDIVQPTGTTMPALRTHDAPIPMDVSPIPTDSSQIIPVNLLHATATDNVPMDTSLINYGPPPQTSMDTSQIATSTVERTASYENAIAGTSASAGIADMYDDNRSENGLSTLAEVALTRDQYMKQRDAYIKQRDEYIKQRDDRIRQQKLMKQDNKTTTTEQSPWYDVGIVKGTSCIVNSFYTTDETDEHLTTTTDTLPDYTDRSKARLEPGTAYKFRIAALNECGRGEWSEVSAFKTCLPGFPGAPSAIKITKSAEGAHLSWEPPPTASSGRILEYSVCLAVKNSIASVSQPESRPTSSSPQLIFARVYCGAENQAVVSTSSLNCAHIDTTTKPAIIFRIAAKNEKGYGPATQVRWLQDAPSKSSHQPSHGTKPPPSSSRRSKNG